MNFKSLALSAVVATTSLFGGVAPAEAYSNTCIVAYGARTMDTYIAGGASLKQAWSWAIDEGELVDTQRCWIKLQGASNRWQYVFPSLYRAIRNYNN